MIFGEFCVWSKSEGLACVPADLIPVFAKAQDAPNPNVLKRLYIDVKDIALVFAFAA